MSIRATENYFDGFNRVSDKCIVPVIFVLDTSGSMSGERIEAVKNGISTILKQWKNNNISQSSDVTYKTTILGFSSGIKWYSNNLVLPEQLNLQEIIAGGVTDLGCALNELNNNLSREQLLSGLQTYCAPIICFITDGVPTDEYKAALSNLKLNAWFKHAIKVAFGIGSDVDASILQELTGNSEAAINVEAEQLFSFTFVGAMTMFSTGVSISASCLSKERELDSDSVCRSTCASNDWDSFDSDQFASTTALGPENGGGCSQKITIEDKWGDSDWDDFDSDHIATSVALPINLHGAIRNDKNADALDRRRRLAEALRSGEPVTINADGKKVEPPMQANTAMPGIQVPDGKLAGGAFKYCHNCGEQVPFSHLFCPRCGTKIQVERVEEIGVSQVEFSAVVPKHFIKGEYAMVDISLYEENYRHIVDKIIKNADSEVKEVLGSPQAVKDKTRIRIVLSSPDMEISDCDETQIWRGKYLTYSFPVEVPASYSKKQILFVATVYFNDVIATKLKFIAKCSSWREQKIELTREDVLTAFISYASQDRGRVATIIQGMKKARPDMDVFFDVENLRSGDDWEAALRREIESRDILFLCWSEYAKASKWVETEWRYALSNKGLEGIEPIPLVSPTVCPPPDELKSKHFNDKALLYNELK